MGTSPSTCTGFSTPTIWRSTHLHIYTNLIPSPIPNTNEPRNLSALWHQTSIFMYGIHFIAVKITHQASKCPTQLTQKAVSSHPKAQNAQRSSSQLIEWAAYEPIMLKYRTRICSRPKYSLVCSSHDGHFKSSTSNVFAPQRNMARGTSCWALSRCMGSSIIITSKLYSI